MTSRFQSFEDAASPAQGTERIPLLRAELARRGLGGFVVPRADEHQGEYVPANAERLAWLTGFTGSAGGAVVLTAEAAIVVDGRYTLQAAAQVDTSLLTVVPSAETSLESWIEAHLPAGASLGYLPVIGLRDLAFGLYLFALARLATRRAVGTVLAITVLIPAGDVAIVALQRGFDSPGHLLLHAASGATMAGGAAWLLHQSRQQGENPHP